MQPLVSIIIPTFNSELFLKETLASVLAQTYPNWECILVDDGSIDETQNIGKQYHENDIRFRIFKRPLNLTKGPSSARNYGIKQAKGDYILFLDADDLLARSCLENRIEKFSKNQDCDFLVFQMDRFLEVPDFSKKHINTEQDKNKILESFIHLHGQWPITSPIYKTTFFKGIQFNNDLIVFEDLDVAIKAIIRATDFKIFKNIDCYYRNDENYKTKYNSLTAKFKMVKGFQYLILSIANLIKSNSEALFKNDVIKANMIQSYKKFFRYTILENSKEFHKDNKRIVESLRSNGFLSSTEEIKFRFIAEILLPFASIKGSGISRLIKHIYT